MPSKISIKLATSKNLKDIIELITESLFWKNYYPNLKTLNEVLGKAIENDYVYIAEGCYEICGFIWFTKNGMFSKCPYLNLIYVGEKYRKYGVSDSLIRNFEEQSIKILNVPKVKIFLLVDVNNKIALNFYKKHGYKIIMQIDGVNRKSMREYLMCKEIIIALDD